MESVEPLQFSYTDLASAKIADFLMDFLDVFFTSANDAANNFMDCH